MYDDGTPDGGALEGAIRRRRTTLSDVLEAFEELEDASIPVYEQCTTGRESLHAPVQGFVRVRDIVAAFNKAQGHRIDAAGTVVAPSPDTQVPQ